MRVGKTVLEALKWRVVLMIYDKQRKVVTAFSTPKVLMWKCSLLLLVFLSLEETCASHKHKIDTNCISKLLFMSAQRRRSRRFLFFCGRASDLQRVVAKK